VDPSAADSDLERLLAQLLRTVSPAAVTTARSAAPALEDTGGPPLGLPVSTSEARALIELLAAKGIAQGQLAVLLGLEKSTVSRLAAGLERKGWLRRGRDERNQRYIRLYLTPAGTAMAGQVWRAWQSRQVRILAALTPEERAGLAAGLRGLVRGLAAEGLLDWQDREGANGSGNGAAKTAGPSSGAGRSGHGPGAAGSGSGASGPGASGSGASGSGASGSGGSGPGASGSGASG
jgi:DNA-binding MarR family transcriptional regulator